MARLTLKNHSMFLSFIIKRRKKKGFQTIEEYQAEQDFKRIKQDKSLSAWNSMSQTKKVLIILYWIVVVGILVTITILCLNRYYFIYERL